MPRSRGHPKHRSNLRWHPIGKPQIPAVIMQGQEEKKRENRGAQGKCIVLRRAETGPYERGLRGRLLNRNYGQGYIAKPFVGKGLAVQIHTGQSHTFSRGVTQLGRGR